MMGEFKWLARCIHNHPVEKRDPVINALLDLSFKSS